MYIVTKATSQPDIGTALIQRVQWKRGMGCAPCGGKCGTGLLRWIVLGPRAFRDGFRCLRLDLERNRHCASGRVRPALHGDDYGPRGAQGGATAWRTQEAQGGATSQTSG